jgi:hypothetical protein
MMRGPLRADGDARARLARLFLVGLAAQSLHFTEEFLTGFQARFPPLLDLDPWSPNFFVAFNLIWLAVWILSAIGLERGDRIALLPIWFFAIASIANGIGHPVLSLVARGYFPGLITSPVVGGIGVMLWRRLIDLTRRID